MDSKRRNASARGFSLVELLVGTILFTIITGIAFSVLLSSQLRYQGESNVTEVFQQANIAIDQITRDVHSAGYPPRSSLSTNVANTSPNLYALPFAWAPSYPATTCTVGATCTVPGDYELIVEAQTDNNNGVQWIRYSLQGTTLLRGVAPKQIGADPVGSTAGFLVPYLENVMNSTKSLPVFSYGYDAGATHVPSNIREVNVSLIVQSPQPDPQTRQYRTVTLTGQAIRFNPNQ